MAKKTSTRLNQSDLKVLLRKKQDWFLKQPNVTSVGIGYKDDDPAKGMCIRVTVEKKKDEAVLAAEGVAPLPESILSPEGEEIDVDVIERSYEHSYKIISEVPESLIVNPKITRRSRLDPIMPGVSVSHFKGSAGTVGAIVYDRETGEPLVLSNWHVLQGPVGEIGDLVVQPGPYDNNDISGNRLGLLKRSHLGIAGDCAVCSIDSREFKDDIFELGIAPRRIAEAELGDKVVKSGRTSGKTYGIVRSVGVVTKINYGGDKGEQQIGGFEIKLDPDYHSPNDEISMGGDSGSLWMINTDGEDKDVIVGLHFAGEVDPNPDEHAVACNIHSVLQKLGISLTPREPATDAKESIFESLGYRLDKHAAAANVSAVLDLTPEAVTESATDTATVEQLQAIERLLEADPEGTLEMLRSAWDGELTLEQARSAIAIAKRAVSNPSFAPEMLTMQMAAAESLTDLPPDFNFPGMDLKHIKINPDIIKFEHSDWLGWAIFDAKSIFRSEKAPFRSAENFKSKFEYKLEGKSDESLDIALFSDFGTGLYHSRYIAKHLASEKCPYAFHLGDVYYAGRKEEFETQFKSPLQPMLENGTELFMLNSNHEMHSGGVYYFETLDWKRNLYKKNRQEGSYFTVENDKYNIIGIDTDYYGDHRYARPELQFWLRERLREGKKKNKVNILLSADHPYTHKENNVTKLYSRDLKSVVMEQLVDLWFWGNTHYCGLFDRTERTPFIGCCIGHGGFPYAKIDYPLEPPAPVVFLETESRFFPYDVRKDMGNNGYCMMKLNQDYTVELRFIDWRKNERFSTKISRITPQGPLGRFT